MPDLNPLLKSLAAYPAEALYGKKRDLEAQSVRVFDFSVGDPLEPTTSSIVDTFRTSIDPISQYPTIRGSLDFRRACADWLKRRFNLTLDPETQILPSSGSKEAIFHLPFTFLNPQTRPYVLFGVPGYPVYERGTLFAGGKPWAVELKPEQGYQLEPWNLDQSRIAQTSIIWINYPHNPTSATVDKTYLKTLVDFAVKHDILICSDECYADLYFDEPPPSILEVADRNVLAFHSLSKRSGMTGYRSGFIAGPKDLIAELARTRANFGVAMSQMIQKTSITAWNDDEHAKKRRDLFRQKRDVFVDFFRAAKIEHVPCTGTLYLWVRTPKDEPSTAYADRLAQKGILVSSAAMQGVDQPYVRLALVPTLEECKKAVELWQTISNN